MKKEKFYDAIIVFLDENGEEHGVEFVNIPSCSLMKAHHMAYDLFRAVFQRHTLISFHVCVHGFVDIETISKISKKGEKK